MSSPGNGFAQRRLNAGENALYLPATFEEKRPEVLRQLIREHGLATIVTLGAAGLSANHIPLLYDPEPTPWGTLHGHVARANPMWREFSADVEALAIFQGPQRYITPSWYPTKSETGKVVPTFNYLAVHAYGPLKIIDDPTWLRGLVESLTDRYESDREAPWHVADAPADFIDQQLRAIVGIEIPISRLLGKWKVSQNRPAADRDGVIRGLREEGDPDSLTMAYWVEDRLLESNP